MKRTLFHQSSMTEGPVLQGMLAFFLPIMLGTLLQQLYSAVDAVVLGQFVGKPRSRQSAGRILCSLI